MEANRKKSCRAFSSNANSILILLGTGLHSVPVGALSSGRHEFPYEPWFRGLKDNRQGARMKDGGRGRLQSFLEHVDRPHEVSLG